MDYLTMFFIAIGLSMDAFAISVAGGMALSSEALAGDQGPNHGRVHALRLAAFFGGFQALMPVIGWLAGLSLKSYIASYDHWAAFGLLSFLGGKMIYEAALMKDKDDSKCGPGMSYAMLLGLSIATSLDALAVGVTFAFLQVSVATPVIVIGVVTFLMSYGGVWIGRRFCNFPGAKVEMLGGLILIGIGVKILAEHLVKGI